MNILDNLKQLRAKMPTGLWFARCDVDVVWIENDRKETIIAWPGFDSSSVSKVKHADLARFIADAANTSDALIAAVEAAKDYLEMQGANRRGVTIRDWIEREERLRIALAQLEEAR